jgi:HAD superfamily hydrolase (TIGR01509 family)
METRWSSVTKLVVLITVLVIGAGLFLRFNDSIPPLLIAFIIAYLLKPPTDWLVRRTGMARGLAIILIFLIILVVLGILPLLVTPSLVAMVSNINFDVDSLAPILENLDSGTYVLGPLEIDISDIVQRLLQGLQDLATPFASGALQIVSGVASSVAWVLFVVVVVFWLVKDSHKFEGWFLERLPKHYRPEVLTLMHELGIIWGSFFRGELVLAVIIGFLVGISMWILGLDNVILLAFIAGLMEFIPTVGPIIATIPAILFAWFSGSSWLPINNFILVLIVIVVYLFVFQLEQLYLLPRVVGRRVRLHPGVVFVGIIIGAFEFGLLGVLLAAPVIASGRLFGNYIYRKMLDLDPFPISQVAEASALEWKGMMRGYPVVAILLDLDGTLADTDDQMVKKIASRLGILQRIFPGDDAKPFIRHFLLLAEGPINWFINRSDRLDLDDELFRVNRWIRRILGYPRAEDLQPIDGIHDTLFELSQKYQLALVTTRCRETAEKFLADNDLTRLFNVIVTRDDVQRLKPHPEPILQAIDKLGVAPERCVMVGDTSADMTAAQSAGINAIGVLCGFGQYQDLREADVILDSTNDLTQRL